MVFLEIMLLLEHGDLADCRWRLCRIAAYSFATALPYVGAEVGAQAGRLGANHWHFNIRGLDGMD